MPLRIAGFHFLSDIAARHCHQRHYYHQRHQRVIKAQEAANAKLDARSQALAAQMAQRENRQAREAQGTQSPGEALIQKLQKGFNVADDELPDFEREDLDSI